jgi:hypothetical protein
MFSNAFVKVLMNALHLPRFAGNDFYSRSEKTKKRPEIISAFFNMFQFNTYFNTAISFASIALL